MWRERRLALLTAEAIIEEIETVLGRARLRDKYNLRPEDTAQLITLLRHEALVIPLLTDTSGAIADDPADEKFLACAIDGMADYLVSGDRHLLALEEYRGIPIVTLRHFTELVEEGSA
jgi:putative PIN family toxin of toxin-antitoxin system